MLIVTINSNNYYSNYSNFFKAGHGTFERMYLKKLPTADSRSHAHIDVFLRLLFASTWTHFAKFGKASEPILR